MPAIRPEPDAVSYVGVVTTLIFPIQLNNPDMTEATVYFWNVDGSPYESLSQWYRCAFADSAGTSYTSTEMYMMYQKATLFGDTETAAKILTAEEPAEQKKLGRTVRNFETSLWDQHKLAIVTQGNLLKFGQASTTDGKVSLRNVLLATGDKLLVEASPEDRVWGIGYSEADAPTVAQNLWGENLLGRALTSVRAALKSGEGHIRLTSVEFLQSQS